VTEWMCHSFNHWPDCDTSDNWTESTVPSM